VVDQGIGFVGQYASHCLLHSKPSTGAICTSGCLEAARRRTCALSPLASISLDPPQPPCSLSARGQLADDRWPSATHAVLSMDLVL